MAKSDEKNINISREIITPALLDKDEETKFILVSEKKILFFPSIQKIILIF